MASEDDGLPLRREKELAAARASLADARERWRDARLHHAVGSAEEVRAWTAYRAASDLMWQLLQERKQS